MRVEAGNATLRTLGWASLGATVVVAGMAVFALQRFHVDGAPSGPPPSSGLSTGVQPESSPGWARPMATVSLVSLVPLLIAGIVLLDQGSASVGFEKQSEPLPAPMRREGYGSLAGWAF